VSSTPRSFIIGAVIATISVVVLAREPAVQPVAQGASAQTAPVVENNVLVPMRDGVLLAADIYRPAAGGKFPVLLSRTPYNKNGQAALAKFFVEHGYAVVVMDSRGLYASKGEWHPYTDEGRDGYDTEQ